MRPRRDRRPRLSRRAKRAASRGTRYEADICGASLRWTAGGVCPYVCVSLPGQFVLMLLKIFLTPFRPAQRHFHRSPRPFPLRRILRALIECHDDVCAQPDLCCHRTLRTEKMRRPIEVRPKRNTLFAHLAQLIQTENLKPARI